MREQDHRPCGTDQDKTKQHQHGYTALRQRDSDEPRRTCVEYEAVYDKEYSYRGVRSIVWTWTMRIDLSALGD